MSFLTLRLRSAGWSRGCARRGTRRFSYACHAFAWLGLAPFKSSRRGGSGTRWQRSEVNGRSLALQPTAREVRGRRGSSAGCVLLWFRRGVSDQRRRREHLGRRHFHRGCGAGSWARGRGAARGELNQGLSNWAWSGRALLRILLIAKGSSRAQQERVAVGKPAEARAVVGHEVRPEQKSGSSGFSSRIEPESWPECSAPGNSASQLVLKGCKQKSCKYLGLGIVLEMSRGYPRPSSTCT